MNKEELEQELKKRTGCNKVEILLEGDPRIDKFIEMKGGRARNEKEFRN